MTDENLVGRAIAEHLSTLQAWEPLHRRIHAAFGPDFNLVWADWMSLCATILSYRPDVILELGRGAGTSTALFRLLGVPVVSVCRSKHWHSETVPMLELCEKFDWTQGVIAIIGEITSYEALIVQDYEALMGNARRILIFWDAHGYEVADIVLSIILPKLYGREVLIACHDLLDSRYLPNDRIYGSRSLWRKQEEPDSLWVHIGKVHSYYEELISIIDFTSRNHIDLHSAMHSIMVNNQARRAWNQEGWVEQPSARHPTADLKVPAGHKCCNWHYFTLPKSNVSFPAVRNVYQRQCLRDVTKVPVSRILPIGEARITDNQEAITLTTAPSQWAYGAEAKFDIPRIESESRIVRIELEVESGVLGVGWLREDQTAWVTRAAAIANSGEKMLTLVIPARTRGGKLVFDNWTRGSRPARAVIRSITVS